MEAIIYYMTLLLEDAKGISKLSTCLSKMSKFRKNTMKKLKKIMKNNYPTDEQSDSSQLRQYVAKYSRKPSQMKGISKMNSKIHPHLPSLSSRVANEESKRCVYICPISLQSTTYLMLRTQQQQKHHCRMVMTPLIKWLNGFPLQFRSNSMTAIER